jgi:hypothetical protein
MVVDFANVAELYQIVEHKPRASSQQVVVDMPHTSVKACSLLVACPATKADNLRYRGVRLCLSGPPLLWVSFPSPLTKRVVGEQDHFAPERVTQLEVI